MADQEYSDDSVVEGVFTHLKSVEIVDGCLVIWGSLAFFPFVEGTLEPPEGTEITIFKDGGFKLCCPPGMNTLVRETFIKYRAKL